MRHYLLAGLIAAAMAVAAWGYVQIGGDDGVNDSVGGPATPISFDAMPGPPWEPGPTPTPRPTDGPQPSPPEPRPAADQAPADDSDAAESERPPEAPPAPAAGTLVEGVTLTTYACIGDGTGAYCGTMASGQTVHRGAVACGYAWDLGQRLRIVGDPLGMIYTCKDRGGGLGLYHVDVWFYDYYAEGRPWRVQLPPTVAVELLP